MTTTPDALLASLEARRQENVGKQVDNAALPAGAAMYYYCHGCGAPTAVKPESWVDHPPPRWCGSCQPLVDAGLLLDAGEPYDKWLAEHDHPRVPR